MQVLLVAALCAAAVVVDARLVQLVQLNRHGGSLWLLIDRMLFSFCGFKHACMHMQQDCSSPSHMQACLSFHAHTCSLALFFFMFTHCCNRSLSLLHACTHTSNCCLSPSNQTSRLCALLFLLFCLFSRAHVDCFPSVFPTSTMSLSLSHFLP